MTGSRQVQRGRKRKKCAFVLSGGGAKGALQVGALRALQEAGIKPDMLVGTSIGAVNAAFVALRGFSAETMDALESSWQAAAKADLLPDRYLWLTLRALFNRPGSEVQQNIRSFFVAQGLSPDLQFGHVKDVELFTVAADIEKGCTKLYGTDPDDSVLNGVIASAAIPPWVRPIDQAGIQLMDGGVVSNLPIEPALSQGATEIIALDLADPRPVGLAARGWGPFLFQLIHTVEHRHAHLEMQLAAERGIPVHHLELKANEALALWQFPEALPLIEQGYQQAKQFLTEHPDLGCRKVAQDLPWWRRLLAGS